MFLVNFKHFTWLETLEVPDTDISTVSKELGIFVVFDSLLDLMNDACQLIFRNFNELLRPSRAM